MSHMLLKGLLIMVAFANRYHQTIYFKIQMT